MDRRILLVASVGSRKEAVQVAEAIGALCQRVVDDGDKLVMCEHPSLVPLVRTLLGEAERTRLLPTKQAPADLLSRGYVDGPVIFLGGDAAELSLFERLRHVPNPGLIPVASTGVAAQFMLDSVSDSFTPEQLELLRAGSYQTVFETLLSSHA